jgi:hypothetical protein
LLAANFEKLTIFEMMTYFSGLVGLPVAIPLVLGLIEKRAPAWAGWSTVLVGLVSGLVTNWLLSASDIQRYLGITFNKRESSDWVFLAGAFMNIGVCCAWYYGTCLFAGARSVDEKARVEAFFTKIHTPVDFHAEEGGLGSDNLQAKVMGYLCLIYGGFVCALMIIPNSLTGRLAYAFCGLTMVTIGGALCYASRGRKSVSEAQARNAGAGSQAAAGDRLARETNVGA